MFRRGFVCLCLVLLTVFVSMQAVEVRSEGADFTMTSDSLNLKASDILAIDGAFTYDTELYTRCGIIIAANSDETIPEEIRGQIFLHGGKGDKYTVTVDFGTYNVTYLEYAGYGAAGAPTEFSVKADGELLGYGVIDGGNGWLDMDSENWQYDEVVFPAAITGVKTIEIEVTDSAEAWPANVFGNLVFHATTATPVPTASPIPTASPVPTKAPEKTAVVATKAPAKATPSAPTSEEESSNTVLIACIIAAVVIAAAVTVIVIAKKKKTKA